jgi:uncharacterized protein with HEPN domain
MCAGKTLPQLLTDWKSMLALERALEILGEAVKRLPPDICARYGNVQWKLVAGMRNRLSHGYDEIDYEVLWNVQQAAPGRSWRQKEEMGRRGDRGTGEKRTTGK